MTKRKTYFIDVVNKLVFISYSGDISIDDVKDVDVKIYTDADYSKDFNRIYDFRFCKLQIDIKEVHEFIDFEKNELKSDSLRKEIYLTNNPNHVVLTTVYSELAKAYQVESHVVSTTGEASRILLQKYITKGFLDGTFAKLNNE